MAICIGWNRDSTVTRMVSYLQVSSGAWPLAPQGHMSRRTPEVKCGLYSQRPQLHGISPEASGDRRLVFFLDLRGLSLNKPPAMLNTSYLCMLIGDY